MGIPLAAVAAGPVSRNRAEKHAGNDRMLRFIYIADPLSEN